MEENYSKGFIQGYITFLVLSFIEGATFLLAGFQLVHVTQWMPLIAGALLMVYGAASLFAAIQSMVRKDWAMAVFEGQEQNKPVSELFNDLDEEDEED